MLFQHISSCLTADSFCVAPRPVGGEINSHRFTLRPSVCFAVSLRSKLDNSRALTSGGNGPHVHLEFCQYAGHMSSYVDYRECPAVSTSHEGQADICQCYAVSRDPILHYQENHFLSSIVPVSALCCCLVVAPATLMRPRICRARRAKPRVSECISLSQGHVTNTGTV